jgi:hypothetical protein
MWSFIARHWRGEISFMQSFWLIFVLPNALLSVVKIALEAASNQGVIPVGLVWLFQGLYLPVFVWQVIGTWRSARRALSGPRSASIERSYNRKANFFAAISLVFGLMAIATIIFPIRGGDSAAHIAIVAASGLGMIVLGALATWGGIRLAGKLIATGRED